MSDYSDHSQSDGWDDNRKSGYSGPYNDMSGRNYGKGHRQQPPFRDSGYGDNRKNDDDRGWYKRPDDGYRSTNPLGPLGPTNGPSSGSNAKSLPKDEDQFERTEAPERRFIEPPSINYFDA